MKGSKKSLLCIAFLPYFLRCILHPVGQALVEDNVVEYKVINGDVHIDIAPEKQL